MTPNRGVLKSLKDLLLRTKYYNAFGLDPSSMSGILNSQSKVVGHFLGGYASSLYLLAETAINYEINIKFKSVMSWGDKMFPHYRKSILQAFDSKVYDSYACNEGIMIAAQKDLDYYYIMSPHVYVEIIDDNGIPVPDGQMGHVIVTQLDNYSMPLVRYRVGDLACKLPLERYPMKRDLKLPLLEAVIGRDTDIVKTKSNKFMIVHFFTGIFEFYPSIKQFKVVQENLDSICIEYIPDKDFDQSVLDDIRRQIQDYLKEPFPVHFKLVDQIAPTKSGKPQIIQSFFEGISLKFD